MKRKNTDWWNTHAPDDKGFIHSGENYDAEGTSCDRCATSIKNIVFIIHSRNKKLTATVGKRCAQIVTKPYSKSESMTFIEGDIIGIAPYKFNEQWTTVEQESDLVHSYKLANASYEIIENYNGLYSGKIIYEKPKKIVIEFETEDPTDIDGLRLKLFELHKEQVSKTP